jgi:hypothetical protein
MQDRSYLPRNHPNQHLASQVQNGPLSEEMASQKKPDDGPGDDITCAQLRVELQRAAGTSEWNVRKMRRQPYCWHRRYVRAHRPTLRHQHRGVAGWNCSGAPPAELAYRYYEISFRPRDSFVTSRALRPAQADLRDGDYLPGTGSGSISADRAFMRQANGKHMMVWQQFPAGVYLGTQRSGPTVRMEASHGSSGSDRSSSGSLTDRIEGESKQARP